MVSPVPVIYIYYGQDEPTLKEKLADFCRQQMDPSLVDLNRIRLDGRVVTIGEIESAARSLPFMADVRLVIVDNITDSAAGRAVVDQIEALINTLPDSTRLIFYETGLYDEDSDSAGKRAAGRQQALKKLINLVDNNPRGKAVECPLPKDMTRWLQERAKHHEASLDTPGARLLAERVGSNLIQADTEIAKLATYAGDRAISEKDVAELTPISPEANIFKMVDALGQRKGQIALRLLRQLLDDDDEPLRIFGMIVRQYRLLILMREQIDSGQPVRWASQVLKLNDYVASKIAEQAKQYRMEHLERIYEILLETDENIKTGKMNGELALETIVARLSK
jgi:DNA polymerase III subunit delta